MDRIEGLVKNPRPVGAIKLQGQSNLWRARIIYHAIDNRIVVRLGLLGHLCTPLLIWQLKPRLGIGSDDLSPIKDAAHVTVPKFFISGDADVNTPASEAKALFEAAAEPKQFWLIEKAGHQDMQAFARAEYESRILAYFALHLK